MKKQIFKLTSILLAMVMVFTMFTIIPVSAEDTAKSTAVDSFVEAWNDLEYVGYADKVAMNHIATYDQGLQYSTDEAPEQAPESANNRVIPLTTDKKLLLFTEITTGSKTYTDKTTDVDIDDIKDLYFYYKSDSDINTYFCTMANDGSSARALRQFKTSNKELNATNGGWTKVSFMDYLSDLGYSYTKLKKDYRSSAYGGNENVNWLAAIGFEANVSADTADFYVSELFVCDGVDPNLEGTNENTTDDQWIAKAAALNLDTLKADYDTTDETKWKAFETAYNALKIHIDAYKANDLLTKAYEAVFTPVGVDLTETVNTEELYPTRYKKSSTTNHTMVDVVDSDVAAGLGLGTKYSQWSISNAEASWWSMFEYNRDISKVTSDYGKVGTHFDDIFLFYKAENVTTAGTLEMKYNGTSATAGVLPNLIPVNESVSEWTAVRFSELAGSNWSNITNIGRAYVSPSAGLTADIYLSSMVFVKSALPENWETLTIDQKIESADEFNVTLASGNSSYYDTANFSAALEEALKYFPECESAKKYAVNNFVEAWNGLEYVGYADQVPMNFIGGRDKGEDHVADVNPPNVPESTNNRMISITATGQRLLFNDFLSTNNFATDAMTTVPINDIKDMYFWYKSTADINAKFYCHGNNGTNEQKSHYGSFWTLPSTNNEWVKYSINQWCVDNGSTWDFAITKHNVKDSTQLAAIGFDSAYSDVATTLYVSELFIYNGVDKNLEGTDENTTDDQWIAKAAALDLETLEKDYDTTTDPNKWTAFETAYNALKIHINAFRADAVKDSASANNETINADAYSPKAVLEEARKINTSEWEKTEADTFKKAVKALETAVDVEVTVYVAGNWYEDGLTIKDLSVLSRYVDATDKDTFLAENFIDLDCANFDDNVDINDYDVIALRKQLLGVTAE